MAMSITTKVLHDMENMIQSKDLIDLTFNPQEAASTANLQILAIQIELDTMAARSFSIPADALATRFPTLLRRLYTKCLLNPQKTEEYKSWWEGLLSEDFPL